MPKNNAQDTLYATESVLRELRGALLGYAEIEAEILLEEAMRRDQSWEGRRSDFLGLGSHPQPRVTAGSRVIALDWARARLAGTPLQHLTGWQVFLDHRYRVSPEVLIPRPETEGLVLLVQEWIGKTFSHTPIHGLEFGLGSGVISIELLSGYPMLKMDASEVSQKAVQVARSNAELILGVNRAQEALQIVENLSDLGLDHQADFLVSNPPYLDPEQTGSEVTREVFEHEPHLALFGPVGDPSFFYRKLAYDGRKWLKRGGCGFFEIPHERASEVEKMFMENGWTQVQLHSDLTGRRRYLQAMCATSKTEQEEK